MTTPIGFAMAVALILLAGALPTGAAAQPRTPVTGAPLPLTPMTEEDRARDARTREQLDYERERNRLDLERRRIENQRLEDAREARGRNLLGAPTYLPPGTTVVVPNPYGAPQYSPGGAAPGYGATRGYPPPPAPSGPTLGRAGCQQYAPAYDEAGRFLANVCVR